MVKAPSLKSRKKNAKSDFQSTVHVYKPYKAGIPALGPYFREIWERRAFLWELSSSKIRSGYMGTALGKAWNILNPLLMGIVYFLLVMILRGGRQGAEFFVYLIAGMFFFTVLQKAMSTGATSVTGAGALLTSTSIPRAILPLAAVVTAIRRFLPMFVVLVVLGIPVGNYPKLTWIASAGMLVLFILFSTGIALLFATIQVYFRDTKDFLSYLSQIWMYTSPILWTVHQLPPVLAPMQYLNPAYQMVAGWSSSIVYGEWPTLQMWLIATAWSLLALVGGFLVFVSRERDFAVRI